MVIEPQFGNLVGTGFSEGLSVVAHQWSKFGYIATRWKAFTAVVWLLQY